MNEKTLDRYIKVQALAERGAAGEKEAAQRVLTTLETRYPCITSEAQALHRSREAARAATRPAPPQEKPRRGGLPFPGPSGNWEQIFRYAAGFYETVREVVEDVAEAYYGRVLAENEVTVSGSRSKGSLFIRVKVPVEIIGEVRALNGAQQAAFREVIHEGVDAYIDALMGE